MRVKREAGGFVVTLNAIESRIVLDALQALKDAYRRAPAELDAKVAAAWYSTRGCASAQMNEEETREWLNHLQSIKGANLARIDRWVQALAGPSPKERQLTVALDEADVFLTSLNDYRLMTAARHNLGDAEMSLRTVAGFASLPPARRVALFEVEFLAWVMEELLRELNG
jgi:Domain of unknown function (DUF2017)